MDATRSFVLRMGFLSALLVTTHASPSSAQCGEEKLFASDGRRWEYLGTSVAVSGDRILAGSPDWAIGRVGRAQLFRWDGTAWREEATLGASDGTAANYFGMSVALEGDVAVVGAPRANGKADISGAVYVYRCKGTSWVEEAKLLGQDSAAYDYFGWAVCLQGELLLVGAIYNDNRSGVVYLFRHSPSGWSEEGKLAGSGLTSDDHFGYALSVSGDRLAASAPGYANDMGATFVFHWNGKAWYEEAMLVSSDGATGDYFGFAVALDGDRLLVGASGSDQVGAEAGAAYLLRRDATGWREEQKLTASDGMAGDRFGASVHIAGERAVIGAPDVDGPDLDSGAVYTYEWDGTSWTSELKLEASDGRFMARLGSAVSWRGEQAVAGAPLARGVGLERGAVYLLVPVPEAVWANYGTGWPGTIGVPSLRLSDDPVLGSSCKLIVSNSLGQPTAGLLLVGLSLASRDTALDGTLLVLPSWSFIFSLDVSGAIMFLIVPGDCVFAGLRLYLQALEQDSGASRGVSFTPGLAAQLGE
ncbi:MAG: FG-GAP repeat protein [Planctomycetota bacterium]